MKDTYDNYQEKYEKVKSKKFALKQKNKILKAKVEKAQEDEKISMQSNLDLLKIMLTVQKDEIDLYKKTVEDKDIQIVKLEAQVTLLGSPAEADAVEICQ